MDSAQRSIVLDRCRVHRVGAASTPLRLGGLIVLRGIGDNPQGAEGAEHEGEGVERDGQNGNPPLRGDGVGIAMAVSGRAQAGQTFAPVGSGAPQAEQWM